MRFTPDNSAAARAVTPAQKYLIATTYESTRKYSAYTSANAKRLLRAGVNVFDAEGAALFAGYERPKSYPFFPSDYPGYQHTNTLDDSQSAILEATDFVTLGFERKFDIG